MIGDEARRLLALRRAGVLDTEPHPVFDGLAQLARDAFGVAGAAIVFVDECRTWTKASAGAAAAPEAPRDRCLCRLVLDGEDVVVIEDLREDDVGRDSTAAELGIRFFAGAPMRSPEGAVLGAFALVDPAPRVLDGPDRARLAAFAGMAAAVVEDQKAARGVARAEALLKDVARQMPCATSGEFMTALGRCLTRALDVDFAFVSELAESSGTMKTCTLWERDRQLSAVTYDLDGTPCLEVSRGTPRVHPRGVRELFPRDAYLAELGVDSYAAVPLTDARDRPLGLLGVMHRKPLAEPEDLLALLQPLAGRVASEVERLRTERMLRRTEERGRALLEALPDAVFRIDRTGRYLDAHAGKRVHLPIPAAEFVGKNVRDVLSPEDAEACLASFARALDTREMQSQEHVVPGPDGPRDYEARIVASGPDEVICFVRDVTARKRAEERRRAMERRLLEAQKRESLGDLAGGVAHELNNMLVAVLGNANLVRGELAPESSLAARMRDLDEAAQRAGALAKQMLALSGRGHFEIRRLDFGVLLEEMRRLLHVALPRRVALHVESASALPGVQADASQMRQALLNLVTNAGEAIGEGPGEVRVSIGPFDADRATLDGALGGASPKPGSFVCVEVSDSGPGMDETTRRRCAEPYYSTRGTGRGLGLAAVVGIVRGHGGALLLETAPGEGCRFRLLLPVAADGERRERPSAIPAGGVLVVDDDLAVRTVLRAMLQEIGRDVVEAPDGGAALELLRDASGGYDTVFLDLMMPGMTGDEVCRVIRREHPGLRVILMSGYDEDTATDALAAAGVEFLAKPFRLDDVRAKLDAGP